MTFESAIKRIIWRFQNFETIKVNEKDIAALNKVIDFVNASQSKVISDNIHFAKLYTFCLGFLIKKYDTTIDNPIPTKELHRILNRPLENIIEDIKTQMNLNYKYKILENAEIDFNQHPATISEKEKKKNIDSLINQLNIADNKEFFFQDAWSYEEIKTGITNQIKNFIYDL